MCSPSGGTGSGISSAFEAELAADHELVRFSFLSQPNVHGNLSVTPYNMIAALANSSLNG